MEKISSQNDTPEENLANVKRIRERNFRQLPVPQIATPQRGGCGRYRALACREDEIKMPRKTIDHEAVSVITEILKTRSATIKHLPGILRVQSRAIYLELRQRVSSCFVVSESQHRIGF